MTPTIILDIDDVIVDFVRHWLLEIQRTHGVITTPDQIRKWDLHKCTPELEALGPEKVYAFFDKPGFHLSAPPVDGAIAAVKRLDKANKVIFVTARHGAAAITETFDWFAKYLPRVQHKQIVFSRDKTLFQADVVVDDRDSHLEGYVQTPHLIDATVIGMERPHNDDYKQTGSDRVYWVPPNAEGWSQIEQLVALKKTLLSLED